MTQVDWMTCAGHTEQLKCHLVFAWYQATTFSSLDMMNFMKTQKLEGLLLISKFSWKWTKFKQFKCVNAPESWTKAKALLSEGAGPLH